MLWVLLLSPFYRWWNLKTREFKSDILLNWSPICDQHWVFFPCSFCHKGCYDQCLSSSPGPSLDRALPFHPTTQLPKKYGGKKSQESQRCQGNILSHGRHWFFCCFYNIYILKFQKLFLNPHFYEAIRYQLKQPNDRVVISINELMHSKCSQHLLHEHWLLFWETV